MLRFFGGYAHSRVVKAGAFCCGVWGGGMEWPSPASENISIRDQTLQEFRRKNEFQARKRNPNPNLLARIFSGGEGVFHMKGWGLQNPGKQNVLVGCLGCLAGYPGGARKVCEKKSLCSIFGP